MYRRTILDNGVSVVTEQVPEFRSCTLGVWIGTGSRFEAESQAGVSHFLEHILFKGTTNRSAYEIARLMDGVGGQLNAFTEKERTCYYARVMDQHVPLAVDVLSDMLLNSLLDPEEVERERGVILEEIKMFEDTPDDRIMTLFTDAVWGSHPLGRQIIGTREVVGEMSSPTLRSYMDERYVAGNVMVAAAGRVEHDAFVDLVRSHLGDRLPGGQFNPPTSRPTAAASRAIYSKDCEQAYVCFGRDGLAYTDERRYVMMVMDSILGGSMSSRLFQEIREKRGLVYSVGTFQNAYLDSGLFGIYAGTSASNVERVLGLCRTILMDVRRGGLTAEELGRAKELLKGNMALAMESTSARMLRLARSVAYHDRLIPVEEVISRVESVTQEQVLELASWLLDTEHFTLTVLGPVSDVEGTPARPLESASMVEAA